MSLAGHNPACPFPSRLQEGPQVCPASSAPISLIPKAGLPCLSQAALLIDAFQPRPLLASAHLAECPSPPMSLSPPMFSLRNLAWCKSSGSSLLQLREILSCPVLCSLPRCFLNAVVGLFGDPTAAGIVGVFSLCQSQQYVLND